MIYDHTSDIKDLLKQDLAHELCRRQNSLIIILTKIHINHDQIHHIGNNRLGPIFFSAGDSHTKRLLVVLHLCIESITEVNTNPEGRFVSFKVTPFNDRVLCVYAPSRYSTREQLARGRFFEKLQNYKESRNDGNENKIVLGNFSCTIHKTVGDGDIKRLAVPIMPCQNSSWTTSPEDLWIREYPDFLEFSC